MDRQELYDSIAKRKIKGKDFEPYSYDNGRINKCVELFKNGTLRSGGVLLDVGGAIGDLGDATKYMFSHRIVMDISAELLKAAEAKGNEVLVRDVDRQGFFAVGDAEISIVTALDFIEHIVDPEKFASECFRVLDANGQVFINTPNIQFWKHIVELISTGKFPHTSGDREVFHGGHLAFFTFLDIVEIFKKAGFTKFEQIKDEEGFSNPPGWFWSMYEGLTRQITTKAEYDSQMLRFGCSNLLVKISK